MPSNSSGQVRLSTSGGNLSLEDLDGNIDASTSGGSVHAERIKGELNTKTSGGNLGLKGLSCTLDASTSGGSVDVEIEKLGKFVKVRNSGGNISIKLPSTAGMDINFRGEKLAINHMNNFNGTTTEHHIEGTLNGGGVPVSVDGGSGHIRIIL